MHVYDILKRPVVTEKSNSQAGAANQYTFQVDRRGRTRYRSKMRSRRLSV